MGLYTFHKILIGVAIAMGCVLAVVSVLLYSRSGRATDLALGGFGLAGGASLAFYLRWFLAKRRGR
ncbi:MAG: hypothetical protein IT379_21625 [Deltaproteobacteria bacterium]|nr:hypothetical protein [Deltaproteobacteria bacterium]